MLCLKIRDGETYDGIVDKINEMPAVREALELEKVPDPSTLCKAFERLLAAVWRVLLELTRRFFRLRNRWNGFLGRGKGTGFQVLYQEVEAPHQGTQGHLPRGCGEQGYLGRTHDHDEKADTRSEPGS
jgi:hypothetical protein